MRTKELIAQLEACGLATLEAQVYVAALRSGPSLLAPLARLAEISRSTTYEIVESLAKRGLFTLSITQKRTIYTAASPTQLLKETLDREHRVRSIIPELEQLMPAAEASPASESASLRLDL